MEIVFATDGSESAECALAFLKDLPLTELDHVTVLAVPTHSGLLLGVDGMIGVGVAEIADADGSRADRIAAGAADALMAVRIHATAIVEDDGTPVTTIANVAMRLGADLIVIGSRGRGAVVGSILGSTTRALARHAPSPVLVVRCRREAPTRILAATDGSPTAERALTLLERLPLPAGATKTLLEIAPDDKHAADHVLRAAESSGADLIVIGSADAPAALDTHAADRILVNARCAVLIAHRTNAPVRAHAPARMVPAALAMLA